MNIEDLPDHIFYKILNYSLGIQECDIQGNLNLKLVSKYWYKKINTVKFWKDYSKSLFYTLVNSTGERKTIYSYYKKLLNDNLEKHIEKYKKNTNKDTSIIESKLYLEKTLFEKFFFKQDQILKQHEFFYLYNIINDALYNTFDELIDIPVCYFKNSKCIDNLCECGGCALNFHGLLDYASNYVMRGVDDQNRFYILFFYKNNITNRIHYEFIYPIHMLYNKLQVKLFTYSGTSDGSYIGNLSFILNPNIPTLVRHFKRELINISYDYIYRLINFQNCGFVYFDSDVGMYNESEKTYNDKSVVELYFDKDEIEKQIQRDFYYDS